LRYYLIKNDDGQIVGNQVAPKRIENDNYIEVDAQQYNEFDRLQGKERLLLHNGELMKMADPRPIIKVTAQNPVEQKGQPVLIDLDCGGINDTLLIEYTSSTGRSGLLKAVFKSGKCSLTFTPQESGYYTLHDGEEYIAETPLQIAIYE